MQCQFNKRWYQLPQITFDINVCSITCTTGPIVFASEMNVVLLQGKTNKALMLKHGENSMTNEYLVALGLSLDALR